MAHDYLEQLVRVHSGKCNLPPVVERLQALIALRPDLTELDIALRAH